MRTRQRRTLGSAKLVLALAALTMALPMAGAHAATDVTNCTPGGASAPNPTTDCPEFSPDFGPTIDKPWTSTATSITYRWDQQAGESNAVAVSFGIPKGWLIAVNSVKASSAYSALATDQANCTAANQSNAEVVSSVAGMILRSKSGASQSYNGTNSKMLFVHWDSLAKTALLCARFGSSYNIPVLLKQVDGDATYGWTMSMSLDAIARDPANVPSGGTIATDRTISYFTLGLSSVSAGNWNTDATGALSPVVFSRAPFDAEQTAMSADWQVCRDGVRAPGSTPPPGQTDPSCNNDYRLSVHAERPLTIMLPPALTYALDFGRLTGPARIAGTGSGYGESNPIPVGGYSLIRGTQNAVVTWSQPGGKVDGVRQYGPDATVKGYVLVVSNTGDQEGRVFKRFETQAFKVDANNNVVKSGGAPVANPGFQADGPCGAGGAENSCTTTLKFPMTGVGGHVLDGNGKYDLALVTIYSDGARTDGLCDDGTGPGAVCDANRPGHNFVVPGISTWQFLMRAESYSNAYMEYYLTGLSGNCFHDGKPSQIPLPLGFPPAAEDYGGFGNGIDGCTSANKNVQPRFILLVDYATKKADFIIWGPTNARALNTYLPFIRGFQQVGMAQNGEARDFPGQSVAIQGTADTGLVSFGNFKPDGSASSFHFDGITNINLVNQGGTTISGTPCASLFLNPGQPYGGTKQACGVFTLWSPNNWTLGNLTNLPPTGTCIGITVQTCQPQTIEEIFEGVKI
jgi:hypothetical protein